MQFKDLPPNKDPKGGSPKTPRPIPQREVIGTVEKNEVPEHGHDWGHRGIAPFLNVRGNGTFWSSWARQLIAFVIGALSAAYVVGSKSEVLNGLLVRVAKVEVAQERMDTQGTNRSHWRDDEQEKSIISNQIAIEEIRKKVEPIGVMQVKIEKLEQRAISEDAAKR